MGKPKYCTDLHVEGDVATNRKGMQIPAHIYDGLITLAFELGYQHKGKVTIIPFLQAIAELLPEDLEPVLEDADLLPKTKEIDSIWE